MTSPDETENPDCLCARCQAHRAALRFEREEFWRYEAQQDDDGTAGECLGPCDLDPWPRPPEV